MKLYNTGVNGKKYLPKTKKNLFLQKLFLNKIIHSSKNWCISPKKDQFFQNLIHFLKKYFRNNRKNQALYIKR